MLDGEIMLVQVVEIERCGEEIVRNAEETGCALFWDVQ